MAILFAHSRASWNWEFLLVINQASGMKVKAKTKNESDGLRVYGVIFIHKVCCFGQLLYQLRFHNECFHHHGLDHCPNYFFGTTPFCATKESNSIRSRRVEILAKNLSKQPRSAKTRSTNAFSRSFSHLCLCEHSELFSLNLFFVPCKTLRARSVH